MDEINNNSEISEIEIVQGSGNLLAAARKQQQKQVEDIALELNLSVSQIKAIELDQTDGLPEPTYVRGYIRSYAKLLGLDVEEILRHYLNPDWKNSTSLDDIPKGIGISSETKPGFFTSGKIVILLSLALIGGYFWYAGTLDEITGSQSMQQPIAASDAQIANSPPGDGQAELVASTNLPEPQLAVADSPAPGIENELVLSFSETSWVDIRDVSDTRLAYKSYAGGEQLRVSSPSAMSIFIGNAAGVSIEYNGLPYDISEFREGVYAKFVVGE